MMRFPTAAHEAKSLLFALAVAFLRTNRCCSFGLQPQGLKLHQSLIMAEYLDHHPTSRRGALLSASSTIIGALLWSPRTAAAAPPMTAGEADGLAARLERKLRPKPPKVLRSKLNQDFAVLLMRSSYNALDQIDCIAMDQFQRDFFFIRQAEYEPYIQYFGPGMVQQGMLTDPNYFDFISFAQYATISREINNNPAFVFEEQQPEKVGDDEPQKFVKTVTKRDPTLGNDLLASRHSSLVGKAIIDNIEETFSGTASAIPVIPSTLDSAAVLKSLNQLVKLFLLNGFAFDGTVAITTNDSSGIQFCITLINPATLWSGKALQRRGADPTNCFMLKATTNLVSRSGFVVMSSSVKYEGNLEKTFLTIR